MIDNKKILVAIFAMLYGILSLYGRESNLKVTKRLKKKSIIDERLSKPPQDLIDDNGNPELDLVDPFQRGASDSDSSASSGFTSTSLGDMPSGIKVLAIVISENKEKSIALVQLPYSGEPYLVKEGDLVRINKDPKSKQKNNRNRGRGRNKKAKSDFSLMALKTLQTFDFYLFIKKIHPTYIETYQKKRPNQIINLRP